MSSELAARIKQDTIAAMKAKDRVRLGILRQLQAALKQVEIDQRAELDDAGALKVLQAYAKKVRDTIASAEEAGREEMLADARAELAVVQEYLPAEMSDADLAALVEAAVDETGARSPADMGKVMKAVMPKVAGRAEGSRVSALVKARLVG
jgi:hypothetical protein